MQAYCSGCFLWNQTSNPVSCAWVPPLSCDHLTDVVYGSHWWVIQYWWSIPVITWNAWDKIKIQDVKFVEVIQQSREKLHLGVWFYWAEDWGEKKSLEYEANFTVAHAWGLSTTVMTNGISVKVQSLRKKVWILCLLSAQQDHTHNWLYLQCQEIKSKQLIWTLKRQCQLSHIICRHRYFSSLTLYLNKSNQRIVWLRKTSTMVVERHLWLKQGLLPFTDI